MKKAFWTLTMTALVVSAIACGKKDDGGSGSTSGGTVASTPTPTCTTNGTTTTTATVPNGTNCYQTYAPNFLPYQQNYTNGYCGCQYGYRPVMTAGWGISCAPNNWFPTSQYYSQYYPNNGYSYGYYSGYYAAQNMQWTSVPQVTYSPGISGAGNNCFATMTCDTAAEISGQNPCGVQNGYRGVCRATSGGSRVGICVFGYSSESYSYSNCQRWNGYQYVNVCGYNGYGGYGYGYNGNSNLIPR